jgi:glycosyltransferase involved in cell wall biosynthesis
VWQRVLAGEPSARLLVAGEGLNGEERRLAQLAESAGAGHSIRLLGWVPAGSLPGVFAATDVAMLPVASTPLNRAKCPMRLVDLIASGVPVATQNVGEYAATVRNGETGLVTPAGDDGALADAVLRLLRDLPFRRQLAGEAVTRVAVAYAWPRLSSIALRAYAAAQGVPVQPEPAKRS